MVDESKISVIKRNGERENLNLDKIHKVLSWACKDISGVSVSEVELKSQLKFFNKITTKQIHDTLIKTAAELISEEYPNYQYVASKLINISLRKEVYGSREPWHIYDLVKRNVDLGFYTKELLEWYDESDWNQMNKMLKHDRDFNYAYAGMEQWLDKYLVQNRVTKQWYETPQMAYMLISATAFADYPKEDRLNEIKNFYESLSNFVNSLPTPILAGLRTPERQFSSCTLIECGDSLESIKATNAAIIDYVSNKAGIGLNVGNIRAIKSEVRGGRVEHTGLIPFIKSFHGSLKSCSQGGIRGGAATNYFPYFHYEIQELIVLKNNKGTEETRVRHMDYGMTVNRLFYKRVLEDGVITLFSPHEVPDLMDAYYSGDNDLFESLYEKYEKSTKLKLKKTISAYSLMENFIEERAGTGRLYLLNLDHTNYHGPYDSKLHPIKQSNLCAEIVEATRPMGEVDVEHNFAVPKSEEINVLNQWVKDREIISWNKVGEDEDFSYYDINKVGGRIALCTLSNIAFGSLKSSKDLEPAMRAAVFSLDQILSYQNYPVVEAELSTREFRNLGIGVSDLAHFLAKNNVKYDDSALELVDEYMEAMSYYAIKASIELAKIKGPCQKWKETKWAKGEFPWERRAKKVDELVPHKLRLDWESLRQDLLKYGIRNATLLATPPSESNSVLINATNGVEPPRDFVSVKETKGIKVNQVVPEYQRLKNKYDLLWNQQGARGYLKVMAVIAKWTDQAISVNTSYNPEQYEDNKIPFDVILEDILFCYTHGIKTLYYFNTKKGAKDSYVEDIIKQDQKNAANVEEADAEEDCSACKL